MPPSEPPSNDKHHPKKQLDLSTLPPIYLLPTRLDAEKAQDLKRALSAHGARLADSAPEARLFLGRVSTAKRALLEVRGRGLDLEEADEDKDPDDVYRVVKASWLEACLADGVLAPLDEYTVLRGVRKSGVPADAGAGEQRAGKKRRYSGDVLAARKRQEVIDRAKRDAAGDRNRDGDKPWYRRNRHYGELEGIKATSRPVVHRKTTQEWEEEVRIDRNREEPRYVREKLKYACQRPHPLYCPNQDFVDQLLKIRLSRILQLDEIGIRAYSTAIAAIQAYPYKMFSASEVAKLPGCDGKASALFDEWIHSSPDPEKRTLSVVQELEASEEFNCLKTFYDIWGVGAKTAREFYFDRGWRCLDDVVEFGWDQLTRVQQIGVKYYDELNNIKIPRDEVERIGKIVNDVANKLRPGYDYIICGGHRRGKPMSGDVDMVISHHDPEMTGPGFTGLLVEQLEQLGWVTHTLYLGRGGGFGSQKLGRENHPKNLLGHDPTDGLEKAMLVWQEQERLPPDHVPGEKNPNPHRRVDIILAPAAQAGTAVLGWTGGTTYERDLRRYVERERSWKFDSGGLWDRINGRRIELGEWRAGESLAEAERRVVEGCGLEYFPPELRNTN